MLQFRARKTLAAFTAAGALGIGAIAVPQLAVANFGTLSATTSVNVRVEPAMSAEIIGTLSAGEQVERRGDPKGDWTPITYKGQDAWMYTEYGSLGTTNSASQGTSTVNTAVNVRAGTSTLTTVLGTLNVGDTISVTGDPVGGWVPVSYQGRPGWVYGAYLSTNTSTDVAPVGNGADAAPTETPAPASEAPAAPEPEKSEEAAPSTSVATGTAYATTAVNVRSGPSTNDRVLTVLNTGQSIETRGSDQNGWTPVLWNGTDAWISSQYLTDDASSIDTGSGQTTTGYTTTAVNLRTGPSLEYQIIRVLDTNTELALTGVTQDGFSQVDIDGQKRWVSTAYISSSKTENVPQPQGLASTVNVNSSSGAAQQALQLALGQVGKPYVWGATGPDSFDCSGLMVWAYSQVGVSLPRVTWSQMSYGTGVSLSDAQPGDLIITSGGGHVGMYMGDGQMVHAGNPAVGVQITSVSYFSVVTVRRVA